LIDVHLQSPQHADELASDAFANLPLIHVPLGNPHMTQENMRHAYP
jgi:hypothetical protein